jgi:aminomethyltransferase
LPPVTLHRHTPFHEYHRRSGAKLTEFAGFEMPLRYTGDVREHQAVRQAAGLFDISHMGEFHVAGPGAMEFLNRAITNDVEALEVGQALYSPMCRPDGGIVDDLLVYRFPSHYMMVVNAATTAKDFAWLEAQKPAGVTFENRSDQVALVAVQGPRAADILRGNVPDSVLELGTYRFAEGRAFGAEAVLSRTGYTGEDGFEIYHQPKDAARVWDGLTAAGQPFGLELVGLGARDTLRLEMGYMLYGSDIDDTTTPLEAGLSWTVKLGKRDFVGRDALLAQKERGLTRRLVGFQLDGRRVPRHGMAIAADDRVVGQVTSGTFSPSLERPIGMGYVETASARSGGTLEIRAGETRLAATIVPRPFYTRGSRQA